jgi:tyrosyl-tRNA synthetase
MLNKLMLVDDQVIWRYMDLLSSRSTDEIKQLRADVDAGRTNVVAVKEDFAREIVTRFHSAEAADAALARRRSVAAGGVPEDVEEKTVAAEGDGLWIAKALVQAGLAKSSSEGMRLVKGGAVHVDGHEVKDERHALAKGGPYLVRVGTKNKRFVRLVVS